MEKKLKINFDLITAAFLAAVISIIAYVSLGFAKFGISVPFLYSGIDDFSCLVSTKLICENGWFWYNPYIGAPFGEYAFDFSANLLMNFDMLMIKLISIFVKDPIAVNNIRYLLVFPMCTLSAYYTLRTIKINKVVSSLGALIFSLTPYIFFRNVLHLSLSACYFVPLSILLCVWCCENDDSYCKPCKSFFKNRKNCLTVLFTLLIANNGIGYYAFFTCFFLCVAALCNLLANRNIKSIIAPMVNIGFIVFFSALALIPSFIYNWENGSNSSAVIRGLADGELYSLKIAQLFIPLESHGIAPVQRLIDAYNSQMPLVNENQGAYLGIIGIIGFVISMVLTVKKDHKDSEYTLFVLSRMNFCAVLFAVIGGFSALMFFVFDKLRGFNRISIFIMFISITVLSLMLENKVLPFIRSKSARVRCISYVTAVVVGLASIIELVPVYGSYDAQLENNNAQYRSDKKFVAQIEQTLGANAMVYQLPYQPTPEAGAQNNMNDYQLYAGYINSETLSWSYGSVRGRKGDQWHRYISVLPTETMLEKICTAGFTGLYIDNRAYTPEQNAALKDELKAVLGADCISADNGNLSFFDLRGYIQSHNITVDPSITDELSSDTQIFSHKQLFYLGESSENKDNTSLSPGAVQFGPYCSLTKGRYIVKIFGNNLDAAEFSAACNNGTMPIAVSELLSQENEASYVITVDDVDFVEFITANNSEENIEIGYIMVSLG